MLLKPITKVEPVALHRWLENIETTIKYDLPSRICDNVSGMGRAAVVECPGELNASFCAGFRDAVQQFPLSHEVAFIWASHQMDGNLILWRLAPDNHFDKFHHVADLIKDPDVWVGYDNTGCAIDVRAEQLVIANAFSIFGEDVVAFFRLWIARH